MKFKQTTILALLVLSVSSFLNSNAKRKTIYKFNSNSKSKDWRILNDGVMGGVSEATFTISERGEGVFQGRVSTANNGGFASVRYKSTVKVGSSKSIWIRLKGDGKNYQFRMKKNSSDVESYITTFATSGDWQTLEIKLRDLYPSFRGKQLDKPNFEGNEFQEISFLIANKKNESFRLMLDEIVLR